ncbi:MAG: hypothetical protein ABH825_04435, partial [Candidatus Omnitrophota bacterium]
ASWATELLKLERQINDMAGLSRVTDIFEAVERARKIQGRAADVTSPDKLKIGLQASYKAEVSDYRESANWYMFLMLTKQFGQVKNYMEGMAERPAELEARMKELEELGDIDDSYAELAKEYRRVIKSQEYKELGATTRLIDDATRKLPIPGEIVFSDPYVTDSDQFMDGALKRDADRVKLQLMTLGFAKCGIVELTEEQISSCANVFGADLSTWSVMSARLDDLDRKVKDGKVSRDKADRIRANIDAVQKKDLLMLVAHAKNIGKDFWSDYQGCDVIVLNSPHRDLRNFLQDLPRVAQCMRVGNPNSAMVLVDTPQQSQPPLLDYESIAAWKALGGTYVCQDIENDRLESWRRDTEKSKEKAAEIYDAVVSGDKAGAERLLTKLETKLARVRNTARFNLEAQRNIAQKTGANVRRYDKLIEMNDAFLEEPSLGKFTFNKWLSLGGRWVLNGLPKATIEEMRHNFQKAFDKMYPSKAATDAGLKEQEDLTNLFVAPKYEFTQGEFAEVRVHFRGTTKEGDLPTLEAGGEVALRKRQQKKQQNAAKIREKFEESFQGLKPELRTLTPSYSESESYLSKAKELVNDGETFKHAGEGVAQVGLSDFGAFLAYGRAACESYAAVLFSEDSGIKLDDEAAELKKRMLEHFAEFFSGKEITAEQHRNLRGDHDKLKGGDIGALADLIGEIKTGRLKDENLDAVAKIGVLIDQAYLISRTIHVENKNELINELSKYCDAIINVHEFDYPPYLFHYLCTNGFGFGSDYFKDPEKRKKVLELSYEHYRWVHEYMRELVINKTDLRKKDSGYIEDLMGDYKKGSAGILYTHDAPMSKEETFWENVRALRDTVVLIHDRFALPHIVKDVDPGAIGMDKDIYVAVAYPPGNTTTMAGIRENIRFNREGVEVTGSDGQTKICSMRTGMTPYPVRKRDSIHYAPASLTFLTEDQLRDSFGEKVDPSEIRPREGVFTIMKFKEDKMPVISCVMNHFTSQDHVTYNYEQDGLPVAWSNLAERMMYMKTVLPEILKEAKVEHIPQIDIGRGAKKADIKKAVTEFVKEKGMRAVVVKPSEQSGGRGAERVVVLSGDRAKDKQELRRLLKIIEGFSESDEVVVQMFVTSSPFQFATKEFLDEIVEEFAESGRSLDIEKVPPTPLYWYMRTFPTQSSGDDKDIAGWALIVNTEPIANYGRGGILFEGTPERVLKPELAKAVREKMEEVTFKCVDAMEKYAPRFVEDMLKEL